MSADDPPKKKKQWDGPTTNKKWDVDPYGPTPHDALNAVGPPPDPLPEDFTSDDLIVWFFELWRHNPKVYRQVRGVGVKLIEEMRKRSVIPD
jgi:hypothetical protein